MFCAFSQERQFDTIYHEHLLVSLAHRSPGGFARHGLALEEVEELPTHGGSLRVHARTCGRRPAWHAFGAVTCSSARSEPVCWTLETYTRLGGEARVVREPCARSSRTPRREGRRVVGYGAPAKGNTLLNYCGDHAGPRAVHGRPLTAQAGPVPAGLAPADPLARATCSRIAPTTC